MVIMKNTKRKIKFKRLPDHRLLFVKLSSEAFLHQIFNPLFIRRFSQLWNTPYETMAIKMQGIKDQLDPSDLYQYFKINHTLNSEMSRDDYEVSIYKLLASLYGDLLTEIFVPLTDYPAGPQYVYAYEADLDLRPDIINLARDLFYNELTLMEARVKHKVNDRVFLEKLKEIHQVGLLPLDISLQS